MSYTRLWTEEHFLAATLANDDYNPGTYATGWADMTGYARAIGLVITGDMQAGARFSCKWQQNTVSAEDGAKDITDQDGNILTSAVYSQADADGDDIIALELQSEWLDVNNAFDRVRVHVTVADAAVELAVMLFLYEADYKPVSTANFSEVVS